MSLSRRSLLVNGLASATWLGLSGDAIAAIPGAATQGIIIGFGKGIRADTGQTLYLAALADLDERSLATIDLSFFGHGFARHPVEKRRAMVFEKRGPGCCEIDLQARKILRTIPAPAGRHFYGHGVYSKDGESLFIAQSDLDSHEGCIAIHDTKTLGAIGTFPTYGSNPHDCLLIDDGATLVITNGGSAKASSPGSVAFVDVKSQKLVDRLLIPSPRLNGGHVAISPHGDLVAVSAPRDGLPLTSLGGVSIRPAKAAFTTVDPPRQTARRMIGEALSVTIHEKKRWAAVTSPDGGLLTIWDIPGKALVKDIRLLAPRGVTQTLDGKHLVVSYDGGKLALIPWESLRPGKPLPLGQTPFGGSHLYTLSL